MGAAGTILWHDYETTGVHPSRDRPLQFAAIRTDHELREVGESPVEFHAALASDALPHPDASLVTGITPQRIADRAMPELDFARSVFECMRAPSTCCAGYNSLRFDDEITRNMFWRNLLPIYDREFMDGNSRWDLIDPIRAAFALRPKGVEWPRREDGLPTFRLEELAATNGIDHRAHDALGDVRATIELARLLKRAQPRLFEHLWRHRTKKASTAAFDKLRRVPFVHTSGRISNEFGCTTVLRFVTAGSNRAMLCADLRHDPQVLLDESKERLRELLFMPRAERSEDSPRVGVLELRLNRAPILAPLTVLDGESGWERIGLDASVVERRAQFVEAHEEALRGKIRDLFERPPRDSQDPEDAIYENFVERADKVLCAKVHDSDPASWGAFERGFDDERLGPLLFRMRARTYPDSLTEDEVARWLEHCRHRLLDADGEEPARAPSVLERAKELRVERADDRDALAIVGEVEQWVLDLLAKLET